MEKSMTTQIKENATPERLARAIKARLAIEYGATSPFLSIPIPIQEIPATGEGVNWEPVLDEGLDTASDSRAGAIRSVAAVVARAFNLERH